MSLKQYRECACGHRIDHPYKDRCNGCLVKTETSSGLVIGGYYWVSIVNTADGEEWENQPQPARYAGLGTWNTIGMKDAAGWPVRSVGNRIRKDGVMPVPPPVYYNRQAARED